MTRASAKSAGGTKKPATRAPRAKAAPKVEPKAPEPVEEPKAPETTEEPKQPEEQPQVAVEPPEVANVDAAVPFGQDPDDNYGGGDDENGDEATPLTGGRATYIGVKGQEGDPLAHASAITVNVPSDPAEGYDGLVTDGTTYTLVRGKPTWIAAEHADWLAGHPYYDISAEKD